MDEQITGSMGTVGEPQYVGFWARFLAMLVDSIWLGVVLTLILVALFGQDIMTATMTTPDATAEMEAVGGAGAAGSLLIQILLPALIIIAFWIYKSATPGKMLISAEIVDAKTLAKPSTGQLIARYIGYYVSSIIFCLGFLWVAFDKRKQGWHDKIAGTVVIKK